MKTLIAILVAALVPLCASAQTAEELIQKNIEAKGGLENLKKINTLRMVAGSDTAATMHYTRLVKRGFKLRHTLDMHSRQLDLVVDGDKGWIKENNNPVRALTPEEVRQARVMACIDGVVANYQQMGLTPKYQGEEHVDALDTYRLDFEGPDLKVQVYLNKENYLERRLVFNFAGKEVVTTIRDWREVRGVKLPFHMMDTGGFLADAPPVDMLRVNEDIPDSRFQMVAQ